MMNLPTGFIDQIGLGIHDTQNAADIVLSDLKAELPNAVANTFWRRLPEELDSKVSKAIRQMDLNDRTPVEFMTDAQKTVTEMIEDELKRKKPISVWTRLDPIQLLVGIIIVFFGISGSLILSGTWRSMLSL